MNNEIEYIKDNNSDDSDDSDYDLLSEEEYEASPLSEEIENKLIKAESNDDSPSSSDSSITKDYESENTDELFNQQTDTETSKDTEITNQNINNQIGGANLTENKYDFIIPLCMSGFLLSTLFICRK